MSICSSLSKPPIVPCSTIIEQKFYLKGKLTHYCQDEKSFSLLGSSEMFVCNPGKYRPHNKVVYISYDSVSIKIKEK